MSYAETNLLNAAIALARELKKEALSGGHMTPREIRLLQMYAAYEADKKRRKMHAEED